jgi:hypothetical protein
MYAMVGEDPPFSGDSWWVSAALDRTLHRVFIPFRMASYWQTFFKGKKRHSSEVIRFFHLV